MQDHDVRYVAHAPPAPLRPFVAVAHGYQVPGNPTKLHRGLPSRHVTLVVELTAPLRVETRPDAPVAAHAVVGGLHLGPALIDATEPQEGMQYALTPLGAHALLGAPAAELRDQTVALADLVGGGAVDLVDQIRRVVEWPERFRVLDRALLRWLDATRPGRRPEVPPEVAEAWRLVFATDGRMRVASIAGHVGWSRRHLSEWFRATTGVTPKEAARIARFEPTRRRLLSPRRPPLVDIAMQCGYADQPHFSREWQALAGCSVGTWLRDELPFVAGQAVPEPSASLV